VQLFDDSPFFEPDAPGAADADADTDLDSPMMIHPQ